MKPHARKLPAIWEHNETADADERIAAAYRLLFGDLIRDETVSADADGAPPASP